MGKIAPLFPVILLSIALLAAPILAQGKIDGAFTYQGQVRKAGVPVNGLADFEFSLWDRSESGYQRGQTIFWSDVNVTEGLFTITLDFGVEVFDGNERWLEIAIRHPSGLGDYTTLAPRQLLTATPYSLQTRGIFVNEEGDVGIGTTDPQLGLQVTDVHRATIGAKSRQAVIGGPVYDQWLYLRSGTGSVATGIYRNSANTLAIGTEDEIGGDFVEDLRITSEGLVGIGTEDPHARLHVLSNKEGLVGSFENTNPNHTSAVLGAETNGSGPAMLAVNKGTGSAGLFSVVNQSSGKDALRAETFGSGSALVARSFGSGIPLEIDGRGIKVTGAGVGTNTAVFIHRVPHEEDDAGVTYINHPLTNNNPGAILFVTANQGGNQITDHISVNYDYDVNRWSLWARGYDRGFDSGELFNVMVIVP